MSGALATAHEWLEQHRQAPNTYAVYERELRRLGRWLAGRGLRIESVSTLEMSQYLDEVEQGREAGEQAAAAKVRSPATLVQIRSVLRQLFLALVLARLRDNVPLERQIARRRAASDPVTTSAGVAAAGDRRDETLREPTWLERRAVADGMAGDSSQAQRRDIRSRFIADWAFWLGMSAKALAAARVSDLALIDGRWYLRRPGRAGDTNPTYTFVPEPAMQALARYRRSKGLAALSEEVAQAEKNDPLVCQVRGDRAVKAWTVAQDLRLLAAKLQKSKPAWAALRLTAKRLRDDFVRLAFERRCPAQDLAEHLSVPLRSLQARGEAKRRLVQRSIEALTKRAAASPQRSVN